MQMGDDATDNATVDVDSDGVVTADCQLDVRTPQSRCQGFYPVLLDKILDNAIVRFVSSVQDSIWQSAPRALAFFKTGITEALEGRLEAQDPPRNCHTS